MPFVFDSKLERNEIKRLFEVFRADKILMHILQYHIVLILTTLVCFCIQGIRKML